MNVDSAALVTHKHSGRSRKLLPRLETFMLLEDVAKIFGVSRSYVWQIEVKAIAKLRAGLLADPYIRQYVIDEINPNV